MFGAGYSHVTQADMTWKIFFAICNVAKDKRLALTYKSLVIERREHAKTQSQRYQLH